MSIQPGTGQSEQAANPAAPLAVDEAGGGSLTLPPSAPDIASYAASPTTKSLWATPGYAFGVVALVAVCLLAIVIVAILNLEGEGANKAIADPNAATIAALSSLAAAYFGIKVASEQSAQAAATTATAVKYLGNSSPNSTTNGNPTIMDF